MRFFLALATGPLVAGGTAVAYSLLTGRRLGSHEWSAIAWMSLLVSMPFIAVALTGTVRKAPWLIGLGLTVALWGFLLYYTVNYRWHPGGTRPNIEIGLVTLVSPFVITAICLGAHWWERRGAN